MVSLRPVAIIIFTGTLALLQSFVFARDFTMLRSDKIMLSRLHMRERTEFINLKTRLAQLYKEEVSVKEISLCKRRLREQISDLQRRLRIAVDCLRSGTSEAEYNAMFELCGKLKTFSTDASIRDAQTACDKVRQTRLRSALNECNVGETKVALKQSLKAYRDCGSNDMTMNDLHDVIGAVSRRIAQLEQPSPSNDPRFN